VRVVLASLSAAGALAAIVLGARHTWPDLGRQHAHLTQAQALRAAAAHEGLPVALFDRWKARLRPGERWWLEIPTGAPEGLTTRGVVYRTYALYWFLPNLPASSRAQAGIVFRLSQAS
jgi:hypothetical protein